MLTRDKTGLRLSELNKQGRIRILAEREQTYWGQYEEQNKVSSAKCDTDSEEKLGFLSNSVDFR